MTTKTKPMRVLITAAICALLATASAHAQTIRIDGDLGDAAWEQAQPISTFQPLDGKTPTAATTGWVLTDAENFYLAFRCDEPMMQKLEVASLPRDGAVYNNDCIEVFVAPFEKQNTFYHLIVDASGQIYDALNTDGREESRYDISLTAKTQQQPDGWTLEMAAPLCELGLSDARTALINFGRERKPVGELSSWHGGFGQPDTWQKIPLSLNKNYCIDVRAWDFGAAQYGDNVLTAGFFGSATVPVRVLVQARQGAQWKTLRQEMAQSTPGQPTRITLPYTLLPQDQPQAVRFELVCNEQPLFRATYQLTLPAQALTATLSVPFYYAEEKWGFVRLENLLSQDTLKSSNIRLLVKTPGGKTVSDQEVHSLQATTRVAFPITSWRSGTGSLTVRLFTGDNLLAQQELNIEKRPGPFSTSAAR